MGLNPENRHLGNEDLPWFDQQDVYSCIFMLVERDSKLFVMYYKTFPYPIEQNSNAKLPEFYTDRIHLIPGFLDLKNLGDDVRREQLCSHNIVAATILYDNSSKKVFLIIQLYDMRILTFQLCGPNQSNNSVQKSLLERVPFDLKAHRFERSPNNSLYFISYNEENEDSIIQLSFKSGKADYRKLDFE